jgi:voltage-gated potassium channel Kch
MGSGTFFILGGYGNTGRRIARLILQTTTARLVVAGRDGERARTFAEELNREFEGDRVWSAMADASDEAGLRRALAGSDMLIVASSTSEYTREIASAALAAGVDTFDVQMSASKLELLRSLAPDLEAAGRCFITDGGFHPGLPGVLVRFAARYLDSLVRADVASVIQVDWRDLTFSDATIRELLAEMADWAPRARVDGSWNEGSFMGMRDVRMVGFGGAFGRRGCIPMFLDEIRAVSETYSIPNAGFYVGGFNPFVDWFVLPLVAFGYRVWPRRSVPALERMMIWGLRTFSKPPFGTVLKLEASGLLNDRTESLSLTISHPDGYDLTAIPVVATLFQYMDGSIRKPGVWLQAEAVDDFRLMRDLVRLGVRIEATPPSLIEPLLESAAV